MEATDKKLLKVLRGETVTPPPIWLMRQAGRYLPEYKETRAHAGGFLDLCYRPDLAEEVTLQPIRRFGFDAAILFADILLLPQALGQKLWFETGEGPRLEPVTDTNTLKGADEVHEVLNPIYETVKRLSGSLPSETTLIGFAGAPWTVATYMIAGRGTPDQKPAHDLLASNPAAFHRIIDRIVEGTVEYLSKQIVAGAEVVKLFDSWAGSLKGADFDKVCIEPNQRIVEALRSRHPDTPIIGFPRGAGNRSVDFAKATGINCIAIDQSMNAEWARDNLQSICAVQGNLDPTLMVGIGDALEKHVEKLIYTLGDGPYIFNLGHGITPDADPNNVSKLIELVRK